MSILWSNNMGSPFHEFRRQASFFFKEKIKTARLVLTDVTPAELMTEEATNGNTWPPDTRIMGVISRAAFEVDDYWRIVDILHKRLMKFDRNNWRVPYKALLLLERLLTHGPLRVADEFQSDKDVIKKIGSFQFVDEKGFNWGLSVHKLCDRIVELLENESLLREERERARNITRGIKGFGSFCHQSSSLDDLTDLSFRPYARSNSHYSDQQGQEYEFLDSVEKLDISSAVEKPANDGYKTEDHHHPFCDNKDQMSSSLLSIEEKKKV